MAKRWVFFEENFLKIDFDEEKIDFMYQKLACLEAMFICDGAEWEEREKKMREKKNERERERERDRERESGFEQTVFFNNLTQQIDIAGGRAFERLSFCMSEWKTMKRKGVVNSFYNPRGTRPVC